MSRKQFACAHCGAINEGAKPSRRSTPQHRRFFAIVHAAYHNWPHDHPAFRPQSEEHLRYWLEKEAGHFTVKKTVRIESTDPDKLYALFRALMEDSDDHKLFIDLDDNLLTTKKTLSIAYEELLGPDFSRLKDAVCEIIETELGIAAERLLSETEKAA